MPFAPELQARIDAIRNSRPAETEEDRLRHKLNKRAGQPGFAANAQEIERKLSEMGGGPDEEKTDGE